MDEAKNNALPNVRAVVRPFITGLLTIVWCILTAFMIIECVPIAVPYILLTVLTWGCTVWYYDDRTFFHRHKSPLDIIYGWLGRK